MTRPTDSEKLMYDVMGAIAGSNMPLVFKGAMVTKLILGEKGFDDFMRETQDIDASWAGENLPLMEHLTAMLNSALYQLGLIAVVKREYGDKMSAGFKIFDTSGDVKMLIDIDMRAAINSRAYRIGDVTFQGVTPDNVIADKINVVASDKVFRRSKDLIDLYALAQCITVKTVDIHRLWERENRVIGTFNAFTKRQDELRHAYKKLRRIDIKPDFDVIYDYLVNFLSPFIEKETSTLIWDVKAKIWTHEA